MVVHAPEASSVGVAEHVASLADEPDLPEPVELHHEQPVTCGLDDFLCSALILGCLGFLD
jgi:hypothetical protein